MSIIKLFSKAIGILRQRGLCGLIRHLRNRISNHDYYARWCKYQDSLQIAPHSENYQYCPKISILLATYNSNPKYLKECLDSVLKQSYQNWELCIADDASTDNMVREIILQYANNDNRIKYLFRSINGHIANATNSSLSLADGDYVTMVDHDDLLPKNALAEFIYVLNQKKFKLIYSDEDKLDKRGKRFGPYFKPDFAPDTLNSIMYIGHLALYQKEILVAIGGFDDNYRGCQDYEMTRRFIEAIEYQDIYHIPQILYHWRVAEGSIADDPNNKLYAFENAKKAIHRDLANKGYKFNLEIGPFYGTYSVEYIPAKTYKVSIIICTCDKVEYLAKLIESIIELTTYKNYEIIIVNNNSVESETLEYLALLQTNNTARVITLNEEFNFSRLNNVAANEALGEFLLFLNNDMILLTPEWLERMLGYAEKSHIGAVGAKLYYEDMTLQHGGVILGYGNEGMAGHIFTGVDRNHTGYYGSLAVPYNYSAVTAACLMIEREKFIKIGKFDERFKVAYNDVEFCLRLVKNGYFNVCLPFVELIHFESKSRGIEDTEKKVARFIEEAKMLKDTNGSLIINDPCYNPNLSLNSATPYLPTINRDSDFDNKIFMQV